MISGLATKPQPTEQWKNSSAQIPGTKVYTHMQTGAHTPGSVQMCGNCPHGKGKVSVSAYGAIYLTLLYQKILTHRLQKNLKCTIEVDINPKTMEVLEENI